MWCIHGESIDGRRGRLHWSISHSELGPRRVNTIRWMTRIRITGKVILLFKFKVLYLCWDSEKKSEIFWLNGSMLPTVGQRDVGPEFPMIFINWEKHHIYYSDTRRKVKINEWILYPSKDTERRGAEKQTCYLALSPRKAVYMYREGQHYTPINLNCLIAIHAANLFFLFSFTK